MSNSLTHTMTTILKQHLTLDSRRNFSNNHKNSQKGKTPQNYFFQWAKDGSFIGVLLCKWCQKRKQAEIVFWLFFSICTIIYTVLTCWLSFPILALSLALILSILAVLALRANINSSEKLTVEYYKFERSLLTQISKFSCPPHKFLLKLSREDIYCIQHSCHDNLCRYEHRI